VLRVKEHAPTFYPSVVFTFGFVVESIKEFQDASTTKGKDEKKEPSVQR
jgi:hypothetical protein